LNQLSHTTDTMISDNRLTIPADAPFSDVQRIWLRGFLDGIVASRGTPQATMPEAVPQGHPVTIIWGSQTGTSESLAKKLAKLIHARGHPANVMDMAAVSLSTLVAAERLVVITSTYGDGEPPDNAAELHRALLEASSTRLEATWFAVLALGDSSYPEFCKCGHEFDQRLHALGATRGLPMLACDVDFDEPFATWSESLCEALSLTGMVTAS
jgi:sulfite reductase (NADPH) flavoprotein alpha-component